MATPVTSPHPPPREGGQGPPPPAPPPTTTPQGAAPAPAPPPTPPPPPPERGGTPPGGGVRENEPRPTLERVGAPSDGTVSVCLSKRPMVATAVMMIATPRSATGPGCSPRKRIAAKTAIAGPEPRAVAYTVDRRPRAYPRCSTSM